MNKNCKDCGKEFLRTGKNQFRCSDCREIEEKKKSLEYARKSSFKSKHGIEFDFREYDKMFTEQQGCCLICKRHQSEFIKGFAVDHCHTTNKVRGLLCMNCNLLLGYAKDNVDILANAIEYLRRK